MTDLYDIIVHPDPVLKQMARDVDRVDADVQAQMDRMLRTMYAAPGIGLAANQVGLLNRVIVLDTAQRKDEDAPVNPIAMANPRILWQSEEPSVMEEGCLSIPGHFADVERPVSVRVAWLDRDGKACEGEFTGLDAHCVQHEIDHLDGVLFIDHLSNLKRNMLLRRYKKSQSAKARETM